MEPGRGQHTGGERRGLGWVLDTLRADLRQAVRRLRRAPGLSLGIVLTLALGIGAATTMFTIAEGVLLRGLPYPDAARLVNVWQTRPGWQGRESLDQWWDRVPLTYEQYLRWRESASAFDEVALYHAYSVVLRGETGPEALRVGTATASLATVLGVRPELGRWFLPGEEGQGGDRVAVLSNDFWRARFGNDPDVLGSQVFLNGAAFTVIGVMPGDFRLRSTIDWTKPRGLGLWRSDDAGHRPLWVPLGSVEGDGDMADIQFEGIGRLRPGMTLAAALTETEPLIRGDASRDLQGVRMETRARVETSGLSIQVALLALPSALLLLIACGNVATLLLGEAFNRRREMATRVALGAGVWRVIGQLLTENLLLGLLGSLVGVAIALGGTAILVDLAPPLSRIQEISVDGLVLGFACALGLFSGALFGLGPAVSLGHSQPHSALRERGGSAASTSRRQHVVVFAEVALTVALLVPGGLLARTFGNLSAVDPGFHADGVAIARVDVSSSLSPGIAQELRERLAAVPGVRRASGIESLPFLGSTRNRRVFLDGGAPDSPATLAHSRIILPGYHEVM